MTKLEHVAVFTDGYGYAPYSGREILDMLTDYTEYFRAYVDERVECGGSARIAIRQFMLRENTAWPMFQDGPWQRGPR